jgi:hypothetical protein
LLLLLLKIKHGPGVLKVHPSPYDAELRGAAMAQWLRKELNIKARPLIFVENIITIYF